MSALQQQSLRDTAAYVSERERALRDADLQTVIDQIDTKTPSPVVIRRSQAAGLLGYDTRTIDDMIARGDLPAPTKRLQKTYWSVSVFADATEIPISDIERYLLADLAAKTHRRSAARGGDL